MRYHRRRLALWDFNGCLLDDLEYIYRCCPQRIFRRFGLEPPPLEVYRDEVGVDFMKFYEKFGVVGHPAEELSAIAAEAVKEMGHAPIFPDTPTVLEALRDRGILQVLVTAHPFALVRDELIHHSIAQFFVEVCAGVRDKREVFGRIMTERMMVPAEMFGVSDTVHDAVALDSLGIEAFVCPRGFHTRAKIVAAAPSIPRMAVIEDLLSLLPLIDT